ncbi:MAG TPA: divergent polysaccharide deacetylase family protein [Candidatus Dormibacteraeota bacterium]|nr:divergent polysaccharide deacetylase family protein [Candidatus Dormibacteraeota bacterium]
MLLLLVALALGWAFFHPTARKPAGRHVATQPTPAPPVEETPAATPSPALAPSASPTPAPVESAPATSGPSAPVAPTPRRAGIAGGPKLALIIDDCGQWIDTERGFVALPIPLTLAVLPYVHYTATIAREASAAGKGVMLHLPMEPISEIYPGPGEIKTSMSNAQITAQTQADLAQVPLAQGVNNHEGSKATSSRRVMDDVMGVLAEHPGLFFIDSRTIAASVAAEVASSDGVPSASRDVFLDDKANLAYTEGQLREAAAIAERTGSAIAIGHPRPTTLAAVTALYPELEAAGIRFVLVKSLTR